MTGVFNSFANSRKSSLAYDSSHMLEVHLPHFLIHHFGFPALTKSMHLPILMPCDVYPVGFSPAFTANARSIWFTFLAFRYFPRGSCNTGSLFRTSPAFCFSRSSVFSAHGPQCIAGNVPLHAQRTSTLSIRFPAWFVLLLSSVIVALFGRPCLGVNSMFFHCSILS